MLSVRVIPCLDVKNGRVVKGVQFESLRDAGDPVEAAKAYEKQGADELVFLDITASSDGRNLMLDVMERVAEQVFMPLTVGGGIRSLEDIRQMLNSGADKISLNSAAISNPRRGFEAAQKFGSQCIVVAIDARRVPERNSWNVFSHGGRKDCGIDAISWAQKVVELGAGEILLTSMDCDGVKSGFDLELTRKVSESVGVPVIASGGAGTLQDLVDGVKIGKADAVLAASIFHFGTHSIFEAKTALKNAGIHVRL